MPERRVLIVEDERDLIFSLEDRLTAEGYAVDSATDGISGEEKAKAGEYDCIVLDVMLPGRDGFQVCRNLRDRGISTPILMLTARSTSIDTVIGLRLGADDYLTKPFDTQILLARIAALIRRAETPASPETRKHPEGKIHFGTFVVDRDAHILLNDGQVVPLNAQEYRLLEYVSANPGRIIDRNELLDEVWGYDAASTTRTVDVHVSRLREKLGEKDLPRHILTVRGMGYKFEP